MESSILLDCILGQEWQKKKKKISWRRTLEISQIIQTAITGQQGDGVIEKEQKEAKVENLLF